METTRAPTPSTPPTDSRSFVTKKLVGVCIGGALGVLLGVAQGRDFKTPPWRDGILLGKEVDTEAVAFWGLLGVAVGAPFAGNRVGLIGWAVLVGMLTGLWVGWEFLPYWEALGLSGRHSGPLAGAALGLLWGLLTEITRTAHRKLLWLPTLVIAVLLLSAHLYRERLLAQQLTQLGAQIEWEYGCIRYVSCQDLDGDRLQQVSQALDRLIALKSLSISGSGLNDADLAAVGRLTRLKWLYLRSPLITDRGLHALHYLTQLEYLSLEGTGVSASGVNSLRSSLPNLTTIRL